MKISSKKQIEFDLTLKSLIGKQIKIINSNIKNQIGMCGILVFESANLLYLEVEDEIIKKLLKSSLIIELDYNFKKIQINCDLLSGSVASRIKKLK